MGNTGNKGNNTTEEYDFHYRKRAVYLKKEIMSLLEKIDSTAEKGKKG